MNLDLEKSVEQRKEEDVLRQSKALEALYHKELKRNRLKFDFLKKEPKNVGSFKTERNIRFGRPLFGPR